jgi:hypothetical protein
MDLLPSDRRLTGALDFVAALHAFAVECAATGVWDDDLTARRRLRQDLRAGEAAAQEPQVKAL